MNPTHVFNGCLVATLVALGTFGGTSIFDAVPRTQAGVEDRYRC